MSIGKEAKGAILAIILLGVVELTFRSLEARGALGEPYDWGSRNRIPFKLNEARRLFNSNPGKLRVVMLGDSRPELAFDPFQFDDAFNDTTIAYNLAESGTGVRFQAAYLRHVVLPVLHPDIVVWEINNNDFKQDPPHDQQEAHVLSQPGMRFHSGDLSGASLKEMVKWLLSKVSTAYHHRRDLQPAEFPGSEESYEKIYGSIYERGYWDSRRKGCDSGLDRMINVTHNLRVHPNAAAAFLEALNLLERRGVQFVVVYGPFNHYRHDVPEIRELLNHVPDSRLLELNGEPSLADDGLYYNPFHLNAYGASIYTSFVIEKVASFIGGPAPAAARSGGHNPVNTMEGITSPAAEPTRSSFSRGPIIVRGDDQFTEENGVINWATADGSPSRPFLIANWTITGGSSEAGILVQQTTKHFVVKNCTVAGFHYGVEVLDSTGASIEANVLRGNDYGAYLANANDTSVTGNVIDSNEYDGVLVASSSDVVVLNNTVLANGRDGLAIVDVGEATVLDNDVSGNAGTGIRASFSKELVVSNNTCSGNRLGIELSDSRELWVVGNAVGYGFTGINARYAADVNISENEVLNCTQGIELTGVRGTTLEGNVVSTGVSLRWYSEQILIRSNELFWTGVEIDGTCSNVSLEDNIYHGGAVSPIGNQDWVIEAPILAMTTFLATAGLVVRFVGRIRKRGSRKDSTTNVASLRVPLPQHSRG
ncbi:MAG: hypothetical protein Kow0069_28910 [Promethearchaeota archaeon]